MRIQYFRAQNLLNHRALNVQFPESANLILIAGPNGSGKSAILEGIRVALGASAPRDITTKKDMPELITQGETTGWAGVTVERDGREAEYKFSLKTGNFAGSSPPVLGAALYSLDPAAFFKLSPGDRRKVLFQHAGVAISKTDIVRKLVDQGHDKARVDVIEPHLGAGMTKTAEYAKTKASEARGAWQAITGETYGSTKGGQWKAEPPEEWDDPNELAMQSSALLKAQDIAVRLRDQLEDAERQHQGAEDWRRQAATIGERESDVAVLEESITAAKAKLASFDGAGRSGWTCPCPKCGTVLFSPAAATLEVHVPSDVSPATAAREKVAATTKLAGLESDLRKEKVLLDNARAAKLAIERLPERPTAEQLRTARANATAAIEEFRIGEEALRRAQRLRDEAASAVQRTEKAMTHHKDVEAYTALSAALEALPGQFLGEALKAINDDLRDVSGVLGNTVTIGEDMDVRYGTIPYHLASRSQKWRTQLALAFVLARKGSKLVAIDEFDLVDLKDRGAILQMLASQTDVQAIVGATLKAKPPSDLPGVFTYWTGRD